MKTRNTPPLFAQYLFRKILPGKDMELLMEEFNDDFEEKIKEKNLAHARAWYWKQVVKTTPDFIMNSFLRSYGMLKNYIKITFRNFKRQKGYSFINIIGLAIGMTCSVLMLLWVQDELNYDRFNENYKNIYRVIDERRFDTSTSYVVVTPPPLGPYLKENYSEISNSFRIMPLSYYEPNLVKYGDKKFYEQDILIADPEFLEVFTFPLAEGDAKTALNDPNSIILSKNMAEKYFGELDPIGEILCIESQNLTGDITVTGVFENQPSNSHLKFDFIVPFNSIRHRETWGSTYVNTYVLLDEKADYKDVTEKISNLRSENSSSKISYFFLQPLEKIHLYSNYSGEINGQGDIKYVYFFSTMAVFILLIACTNFINLSTARSKNRAKEVGMRKVVGAVKRNLIHQFFMESIVMSILAAVISLVLIWVLLPVFNNIAGKEIVLDFINNKFLLSAITGIVLFAGVFSGIYPALYLSSFHPVNVLKGTINKTRNHSLSLRRILVVFQFALTIIVIIGTTVIYSQLEYFQNKKLGYDKHNLIQIRSGESIKQQFKTFKNELLQNNNILAVTATDVLPNVRGWGSTGANWSGKDPELNVSMTGRRVEYDFINAMKMNIVDGRDFSRDIISDTLSLIVNESAADIIGREAIFEKRVSWMRYDNLKIIGIVENFNFASLHDEVEPLIIQVINITRYENLLIRYRPENIENTLTFLEQKWEEFSPDTPFEYSFLDGKLNSLYDTEKRIGMIFKYFTFFTIFVACLGLLGLSSFTAEQRTKEIGIRKVLGASFSGLISLLTREFIILITISNLVAWPIGYIGTRTWLQTFAYHIDLSILNFVVPGLGALLIAILAVSYQSVKAAAANPANTLKFE